MNKNSDAQLLRQFAEHGRDDAFREIVTRHANFVYSAALRQVESPDLAADLSQNVFVDLASKARHVGEQLPDNASLAGWLHRSMRYAALNHWRDTQRRRTNERLAMEQLLTDSEPTVNWEQIRPALDEALDALSDDDREALLLRYFKNLDFRAVGLALGVSDDTAQKRVGRALERLREFFSKRKITVGASGLAVLISANAVQSAPLGLAATISAAAILTGTAVSTSTIITAAKTITMTTFQKTLITAAFIATAGAGIFEAHQAAHLRVQNQTFQQQQSSFADQLGQLQQALNDATNRLANVIAENEQIKSNPNANELLKLRGEVTVLQNAANDPTAIASKAWLERVNKLRQRLAKNPNESIPELQLLGENDWLNAAMNSLKSENDYRKALSSLRNAASSKVASDLSAALLQYFKANNQQFPTDISQLTAFFDPQLDDSILSRWDIEPASNFKNSNVPPGNTLIVEKEAVDGEYDYQNLIGERGDIFSAAFNDIQQNPAQAQENKKMLSIINPVLKAYSADHNGQLPSNPADALPYATTPEQQVMMQKMVQMYQQAQQHIQSATNQNLP